MVPPGMARQLVGRLAVMADLSSTFTSPKKLKTPPGSKVEKL